MIFGKKDIDREVIIENKKIENVIEFTYLGSVIPWDNDCMKDINTRIAKAIRSPRTTLNWLKNWESFLLTLGVSVS